MCRLPDARIPSGESTSGSSRDRVWLPVPALFDPKGSCFPVKFASDPHGHYHVAVMVFGSVAHRAQFAGALLVLQLEGHLLLIGGAQKIEQILGVESNLHVRTRIFAGDALLAFPSLDGRRENLDFARGELHADGARALVGKLRDTLDRRANFVAVQLGRVYVVFWQNLVVVREVARKLAGNEKPFAKLEEQVVLVTGKNQLAVSGAFVPQLYNLGHGFLMHERSKTHASAGRGRRDLHISQPMTVRGYHGGRIRLQQQQSAIQSEAGFLQRDGKRSARDHGCQQLHRNLAHCVCHLRQLRETFPRHSSNACTRPATRQTGPMVLQELDGQIHVRQQPHVVQQLAGRDGTRSLFLDLSRTRAADAQLQIGDSKRNPVVLNLQQHVGKDRNRGVLLDHTLREAQFSNEVCFADGELHVVSLLFSRSI